MNDRLQESFRKSKWIEVTDNGANRSLSRKISLLNSYLFTKNDAEGEIQGATILGKLNTHKYHWAKKAFQNDEISTGAQKL